MSRNHTIALVVAAVNLLLIALFPPVDQYSIAASKVPVFAGFHFAFALPPNSVTNASVLWLEVMVVLINAGIALLLLRQPSQGAPKRRLSFQNAVLIFTGANLVLALLFPPFESVFALTSATLPTFEGFYFLFFQKPNHVIVMPLLYMEMVFILVNGSLLWLMFKPRHPA